MLRVSDGVSNKAGRVKPQTLRAKNADANATVKMPEKINATHPGYNASHTDVGGIIKMRIMNARPSAVSV